MSSPGPSLVSAIGRHPWGVAAIAAVAVVGGLVIAVASIVPLSSETARRKVIAALASRFDAEVELTELRLRVLPRFHAEGRGLAIRHKGRTDVPPLISIAQFTAAGSLVELLRGHVSRVVVDGLDIEIPPDRNRDRDGGGKSAASDDDTGGGKGIAHALIVDELTSTEGRVVIIPRDPKKSPKVWSIHRLRMHDISLDRPMPFVATLENGVPPGNIETSGSFGPWGRHEPGRTPLSGTFTFDRADLGVFKGISGLLSARGAFSGTLGRIDVQGETDTPQFTVTAGGHPVPLHTVYHAIVDGTNGDTLLEKVEASFLNTTVLAKGGVMRTPGIKGRTVTLDVVMDRARLEDVLRMAIKAPQSPMVGALKLSTTFVLPPGDRDVVEKLQLAGAFTIANTQFASPDVQAKIDGLSHRTRGKDPDRAAARVASQFAGTFKLANGTLNIPHVTFDVPGSAIRLSGQYGLESEQIDFAGTVFTEAKVSEMTSGFKRLLLKPVDLLFSKNGGSAIPITISGTRDRPSFGLDKGRVLKRQ